MGRSKALICMGVAVAAALSLAACTGGTGQAEFDRSPGAVNASTPGAAEPVDRLTNRLIGLTDLQGRPLYVVPEAQTRNHLEALTKPPLFERVYAPSDCAPHSVFTPPPRELEGVLGRSNLTEDRSTLRAEIYTAPNKAELVDYFVGADPGPTARCEEFSVTVNDITQHFSYTPVDAPSITPHSRVTRYRITQDGSVTHYVRVTAVNGLLAASLILSTMEPAGQDMTDEVLRLTRQAVS